MAMFDNDMAASNDNWLSVIDGNNAPDPMGGFALDIQETNIIADIDIANAEVPAPDNSQNNDYQTAYNSMIN